MVDRRAPTRLEDLAIFGGRPAFAEPLHVGRPNIGDRDRFLQRVGGVFDRRWLTNNGPLVQEFEEALRSLTGARHCIPVCNATIGLEIAVRALGMQGEVIVPSFTFVATAHALQWQAIAPVFCDVDPTTHCLDPRDVETLVGPKTSGIIGTHVWGRPCDVGALQAIADRHGLRLIFDAAHALGCSLGGAMIGNFGEAEVFSFHATKFVNSFEGGAIATNDDELAKKVRLMINFGFAGFDTVVHIGTNGKMSEVSAAMGLTSLESFSEFVAINRENYASYRERLGRVPGLSVVPHSESESCNFQYVVVEVDERAFGLHRDALLRLLHAENVLVRRYFYPGCHRMEPYRTLFPAAGASLPETEALCGRVLVMPTGSAVSAEDIESVCAIVGLAASDPARVARRVREVPAQ